MEQPSRSVPPQRACRISKTHAPRSKWQGPSRARDDKGCSFSCRRAGPSHLDVSFTGLWGTSRLCAGGRGTPTCSGTARHASAGLVRAREVVLKRIAASAGKGGTEPGNARHVAAFSSWFVRTRCGTSLACGRWRRATEASKRRRSIRRPISCRAECRANGQRHARIEGRFGPQVPNSRRSWVSELL